MAQNPVVYSCPQSTWTQIAASTENGLITLLEPKAAYRITYRISGDPAPADSDALESPKVQSLSIDIVSDAPIDVYIWVAAGDDGKVEVELQ